MLHIYQIIRFGLLLCLCTQAAYSQNETIEYDDIYFDGEEKEVFRKNKRDRSLQIEEYEDEVSETETVNKGFYEDEYNVGQNFQPYENDYTSTMHPFYNGMSGFSFYNNPHLGNIWFDSYDPYFYGANIYAHPNYGYSNGWGASCYQGWNNPYFNYYNYGWGNPYSNYNNWGWGNPYCQNNNGFYGNNWNNSVFGYYNNNQYGFWGYNYGFTNQNSTNFVIRRSRRGLDVVRGSRGNLSHGPGGRMLKTSNNSTVDVLKGGRSNVQRGGSQVRGKAPVAGSNTVKNTKETNRSNNTYSTNRNINSSNKTFTPNHTTSNPTNTHRYNHSARSPRFNNSTSPSRYRGNSSLRSRSTSKSRGGRR